MHTWNESLDHDGRGNGPGVPGWLIHATFAAALLAIAAPGLIATDAKRDFSNPLFVTDSHVTERVGAQRPQGPPPWGDPDQLSPEVENGVQVEEPFPFSDTRFADRSEFRDRFQR